MVSSYATLQTGRHIPSPLQEATPTSTKRELSYESQPDSVRQANTEIIHISLRALLGSSVDAGASGSK